MRIQSIRKMFGLSGFIVGLALFLVLVGAVFKLNVNTAGASDCTANAIIKCGVTSASDFIGKVRSSNGGSQNDLATIYSSYGLSSADYNRFITSAKPGTAFKDGTIVVDGQVVATGASSIGRSQKANSHAKVIGGTTYWEDSAQNVFNSTSIPVMVLFDATGKMQFAVMLDCGNPTQGTPKTPNFACNDLKTRQIDRTNYAFSTDASAGNGATINHVVYDFGDGTSVSKNNPAEEVTHNYAKDGTYNAKVTVYVNVPGSQTAVIAPAGNCIKRVVVTPPAPKPIASCTNLTVMPLERTKFRFSAAATSSGGATISRYDFVVRDVTGKTTLQTKQITTSSATASTDVNVTAAGSYSAQVTVQTSVGSQSGANCTKNFTVAAAPVADCKLLTVTPLDRTTYKLAVAATTGNGASVQGYDVTITDASGKTVASPAITTTALNDVTNLTLSNPGTYSANLRVRTSLGAKTGPACMTQFTVPEKPIPPVPSVKIVKTVDVQKIEQVAVDQTFTYQLVVTNDGKVDLKNVLVTDKPDAGVTLLSADLGSVDNNAWSYTIPSLQIGDQTTFTITAKVSAFVAGNLINTACVNAPEVNPGQPNDTDQCDTATVTVPPVTPPTTPTTPTALPDTGAGNVIGIFAATVIVSGLGYRMFLSRKLSHEQ